MDHPIGRVPDTPHPQVAVAVRTAQGVSPAAVLIAVAGGQRGDDLDRPLDDALHCGQGLLNQTFDLCKRFGRLHPVIPDALQAFGTHMLKHAPDTRVDIHRFAFHSLALLRAIMLGHPLPIVAINPPERERWTHHICGEIRR